MRLSIILPTYNESDWLSGTINKINQSIDQSGIKEAEIIIIDDGSTDSTSEVVNDILKSSNLTVRYIKQKNSGRFLARKAGVDEARYDYLLFIDSRVRIHKNALEFVAERVKSHPEEKVWNAHVVIEKKNNLLASFWDVISKVAWSRYFKNPRHVSYGIKDFDYYPKGTTCLLVQKRIFQKAIDEFSCGSKDIKEANDDTSIISNIARQTNINISPEFSCTYYARNTVKKFFSHAYHRGQVFEDGFLRRGNRYFWPLVGFLAISVAGMIAAILSPKFIIYTPILVVVFALTCTIASRIARVPAITWKDSLVFGSLSFPFAVFYGAGIWRAFIRRAMSATNRRLGIDLSKKIWIVAAVIFYSISAAYYMHPVLSSCADTVIEPGDGTAGLVMRNSVSPDNPLWGYTQKLNYPVGENLNQPVNYSAPLLYTTYWGISKVSGPVCGLNVLTFTGFVLTALVGCMFVFWLVKNKWIAVFAGFAISFTPFFQTKAGSHPSYGYQFLLITLLWLVILNWQKRRSLYIVLLGLNSAALAYWDPYFVLLGVALMLAAMIPLFAYKIYQKKGTELVREILPRFVLAGIIAVVLVAPLAYIRIHYADQINSSVKSGRGDLKSDVHQFSNRPFEYLLPAESNPFFNKVFGHEYQKDYHHKSNPGEYTVGLSYALMLTVFSFAIILIWEKLAKGKTKLNNVRGQEIIPILLALCGVLSLGFLLSLPPRYGPFRNLSDFVTDYITMWRAFSRFYVLVNIALVFIASVALTYYANNIKGKSIKVLLFVMLFGAVLVEFQSFSVGQRKWSYDSSVSHIYKTLRDRKDLNTVVSYPLDENDSLGYLSNYFTLQRVYGKPMLNGISSLVHEAAIRRGIADIRDPQTVLALRTLGIDTVIINGELIDPNIPGLELIDEDLGPQYFTKKPVRLYRVLPGVDTDYITAPYAVGIVQNHNFITSAVEFSVVSNARIDAIPLFGRTTEGGSCFTVRTEKPASVTIELTEGDSKYVYVIDQSSRSFRFKTGDIGIRSVNESQDVLVISDFGCQ